MMMRTMLEVADNSGARKLQMIMPLGGDRPARWTGRRDHRQRERSFSRRQVKKGKVVKA